MSNSTLWLCRNNSKLNIQHSKIPLSYSSLQRYTQQLLCFYRKLHWQLIEHVLGISVNDKSDGLFGGDATLIAVEELVLGDF